MSPRKAPQSPPQFTTSAASIVEDAKRHIEQSRRARNKIVQSVTPETATFANVMLPLAHAQNDFDRGFLILKEYQDISPESALREASREAAKLLADFNFENAGRKDMFKLVDAVTKKNEPLDPESRMLLDMQLRSYRRSGLHLPESLQQRLKEIHQRKMHLHEEFRDVPIDQNTYTYFLPEELHGISAHVISRLEKGKGEYEGMLKVPFEYSTWSAVMEYASSGETRKRYSEAKPQLPSRKEEILKEILLLRHEAACLLGYPNHAAFMIEERVAKTPHTVNEFLGSLRDGLVTGGAKKFRALKQSKKADLDSRGKVFDGRLRPWDVQYYLRMMRETKHHIDEDMIAEYFPLQETIRGMLRIFEILFGLVFEEIDQASVWQDDVRLFSVWDHCDLGTTFLGYLYLDLYKRENKYNGVASSNLQPVRPK
jgi:metallopeptidase MepB